ncbi:MAG: hypothetical protein AAGH74_07955 [Pseudomonadota bacterium]
MMFLARIRLVTSMLVVLAALSGWFYINSPSHLCDGTRIYTIGIAGYQECPKHIGAGQ